MTETNNEIQTENINENLQENTTEVKPVKTKRNKNQMEVDDKHIFDVDEFCKNHNCNDAARTEIQRIKDSIFVNDRMMFDLSVIMDAVSKTYPQETLNKTFAFITRAYPFGFHFKSEWNKDNVQNDLIHQGFLVKCDGQTQIPQLKDQLITKNLGFKNKIDNKDSLIIGENYYLLMNLLTIYGKKSVDVIYIDPPYNTKTDQSYNDCQTKDAWLNDFYTKMEFARKLLKDDGVIFISLDDNMMAYAKVIMDGIFGENNFIGNIIWDKGNGQNDNKYIEQNHEYILVYSKNKNRFVINGTYSENDNKGKLISLIMGNSSSGWLNNRPKMGQTIYYNEEKDDIQIKVDYDIGKAKTSNDENIIYKDDESLINQGYVKIRPPKFQDKLGCWKWSPEKMEKDIKRLVVKKNKDGEWSLYYQDCRDVKKDAIKSIISFSSGAGSNVLHSVDLHFSNSKPIELIEYLINLHPNKNAVILDFYAGSGTTGQAVWELNQEDNLKALKEYNEATDENGNKIHAEATLDTLPDELKSHRSFILCTKKEDGKNKASIKDIAVDVAYERLYRVANGQTTDGKTDFDWLKKHTPYETSLSVYQILKVSTSIEEENMCILAQLNTNAYKELLQNPKVDLEWAKTRMGWGVAQWLTSISIWDWRVIKTL